MNSFFLLLIKNKSDKSLIYVLSIVTIAFIGATILEKKLLQNDQERMVKLTKRTQLIFRWIYVGISLGIALSNILHLRDMGTFNLKDWQVDYQILMCFIIALTIPRDILWRKIKAKMSSYSVHREKLK
jgi:hypothetical protein